MKAKESVDNNVQKMRKKLSVTQQDFADAVGVTRQTIISIEKGNYVPSVLLALKISSYFNTRVESVFNIKK